VACDTIVNDLEAAIRGRERVRVGRLFAAIGRRGFGPILVLLALLQILPTGIIPGMADVVALGALLVAVALVRGRRRLRLPRRLRMRMIGTSLLAGGLRRIRPIAGWIGRRVRRRLVWVIEGRAAELVIALALLSIAAIIFVLGLIPFLPFSFAIPLVLIGIGLAARDGAAVLVAYGMLALMPTTVAIIIL
jgi:hypothetical protein